ncbi:hypothetical protein [Streptomyces canus]|uniref:hypothetical protein n=1 Tax=Streptomyces canus TaxID=58343 RepID=UPI002E328BCF|nr:hypothetical protein [Streptomyces canus]
MCRAVFVRRASPAVDLPRRFRLLWCWLLSLRRAAAVCCGAGCRCFRRPASVRPAFVRPGPARR